MSTLGIVQLLFVALALVMMGLGLSLQVADFKRLLDEKRAVLVAIGLQTVVLPVVALLLATAFNLPTSYAVGLMLLAAAPGSISSNLYSHIFGGNVALNMSLTGINTLLSMLTLPVICGWALSHFAAGPGTAPPVVAKLLETMATLVVPVIIGMTIRARAPRFAALADRPMRIFSVFVLIAFSVGAIVKEWANLAEGFTEAGTSVIVFNILSLAIGYLVAQAATLKESSSIAIAFQLGVRSAILSIYIAMTALNDSQMALPAAVYSVTMVFLGIGFGLWVKNKLRFVAASATV